MIGKSKIGIDKKGHLSSIRRYIDGSKDSFKGIVLDVGCGAMPYKDQIMGPDSKVEKYLGLDLENNYSDRKVVPDLIWDGVTIPLPDQSVDCVLATEVLEHCPNTQLVLREIYRVLKSDGVLVLTIPFLWPLHEVPHDFYRLTPFALHGSLTEVGFTNAKLNMLGGWDASLAQILGLWIVRRPGLNPFLRKLLHILFIPIIWLLRRTDSRSDEFPESQMITGIGCLAEK